MLDMKTFLTAVRERPSWAFLPLIENGAFNWMDDERFLRFSYWSMTGERLDLGEPRTFNEKIAWIKLHDHNPLYQDMADKYRVRAFVEREIGADWLVPLLGVWDRPEDIDWDALPDRFVLKCTHGYGGTVICRDKASLDRAAACETLAKTQATDFFWRGREWVYKDPTPRIVAEAYVDDAGGTKPADYKFMCFNGKVKLANVSRAVSANHKEQGTFSFFYPDGERAPFKRADYPDYPGEQVMPESYLQMYDAAEKMAQASGATFVRVDFYDNGERAFFSEFTFYPCGGSMFFDPPEYNLAVGSLLELPRAEELTARAGEAG